jgi:hypothetical protein
VRQTFLLRSLWRAKPYGRLLMARSKKQQRARQGAVAVAARVVKDTVVHATKVTTEVAETYVVEPVKSALGLAKKKPAKKRHARPARQDHTVTPAPLARGSSSAARTMSAGVAKGVFTPTPTGSAGGTRRKSQSQSAHPGSSGSESTSSRSIRRQARRRTSES